LTSCVRVTAGPLVGDYLPGGGDFAVVWVHGFLSHRGGEKAAAVRAECGRRGWPFAAFDFRAHGDSPGDLVDLSPHTLLEDLDVVAGFLRDRGHSRLGLVGSSMGGFAAGWFAHRHPGAVVGCVFVAPGFGFLHRRWASLTAAGQIEWQRTGRRELVSPFATGHLGYGLVADCDRFRPADLAAGWTTPALLFHGWADDTMPPSDSLDFLRDSPGPDVELRLFKGGDHRLTAYKEGIAAGCGTFFARLLAPPA
jgi:pimeloyl-ACP methyl ester carboxylesterase